MPAGSLTSFSGRVAKNTGASIGEPVSPLVAHLFGARSENNNCFRFEMREQFMAYVDKVYWGKQNE